MLGRRNAPSAWTLATSDAPERSGDEMQRFLEWFKRQSKKKRALIVSVVPLLVLIAFIEWWTTPSSGRVLAEGTNLGVFQASKNPFKLDPAHARRFVITKVEVFGPGVLDDFPPDCAGTTCSATPPHESPIVVIWTEPELRCNSGSEADFEACIAPLTVQCGLGRFTYIWWKRDSSRHRKPHGCTYFDIAHPSGHYVMGFVADGRTPPKRFSLVVQGRDVPIAW